MSAQPTPAEVSAEASAWFAENWDPSLNLGDWWQRLAHSGWGFPAWPREWFGRGLRGDAARAATAARLRAGAFGAPVGISTFLTAPTLLHYGTAEQKQRFMPGIATGSDIWCQLFSEPGAGSDMAGLQTRAVRDGDEWVVSGQKVWNSGAQYARYGILIARTDSAVPKHRGITFFLIDMRQPGVEVRPLREMTGDAAFNEVFLSEARVPDANRLGDLGQGWQVAMTTLSHERDPSNPGMSQGGGSMIGVADLSLTVADYQVRQAAEVDGFSLAVSGGIGVVLDQVFATFPARDEGAGALRRQDRAKLYSMRMSARWSAGRAVAAARAGGQPGPEVSTLKLLGSEMGRRTRDTGWTAMGAHATLNEADAFERGLFHKYALFTPAGSIAGGSDEVQHNIIGERVLGLPKEPDNSRDLPFSELRVGTQRGGGA